MMLHNFFRGSGVFVFAVTAAASFGVWTPSGLSEHYPLLAYMQDMLQSGTLLLIAAKLYEEKGP